jgi:site-specific DNA-methyltransferase (adenine-specific)
MTPYYQDRWVTLYCADCADVLPELRRIGAVITDPPYAIPTQVASGRTVTRNVGDLSMIEGAFKVHIASWKRLLGDAGRVFVFCDGASYSVIYRAAYGHFNLASLVWDKGRIGMGREFRKRHELIIHGWGTNTPVVDSEGTAHDDILAFSPVSSAERFHPAEKPIGLIGGELMRVCRDVILDPFCGSGSVLVAAKVLNREAIGIEIEERYCEIAANRLQQDVMDFTLNESQSLLVQDR